MNLNDPAKQCACELWREMDRIDRESGEYGQNMQSYQEERDEWLRLVEQIILKWFQPFKAP